jgi:hypothetical protein
MNEEQGVRAGTTNVDRATEQRNDRPLSTGDIASGTRGETAPGSQTSGARPGDDSSTESTSLFDAQEAHTFQDRWMDIQTGFVDEPRRAVEQADTLVAEVIRRLAEIFAEERSELEGQWGRGDRVSTEDLRLAMQRYRSFFSRLLSIERPG